MSDLREVKRNLAALSDEDLFKMVNQDIVAYEREEISLAYDELERRGKMPKPKNEKPPVVSPVGCLLGVLVLSVELFLSHQSLFLDGEFLSLPRAVALAAFVPLIANYWNGTKFHRNFCLHFLWSAGFVLLGSLALWDFPNLLRQRIPAILAFGIPGVLFAALLFWLYEYYFPRTRQNTERDKE